MGERALTWIRHRPQQSCNLSLAPGFFAPRCCMLTTADRTQIWSRPLMVTKRDASTCPGLRRSYERGDCQNKQRTAAEISSGLTFSYGNPQGLRVLRYVSGAVAEEDLEPAVPSACNTLSSQRPCSSLPSFLFQLKSQLMSPAFPDHLVNPEPSRVPPVSCCSASSPWHQPALCSPCVLSLSLF